MLLTSSSKTNEDKNRYNKPLAQIKPSGLLAGLKRLRIADGSPALTGCWDVSGTFG